MAKCGDCLYFGFCKKYVDPEETFPEIDGGCHVFKNKDAFVEVVRCKDCTYWDKAVVNKKGFLICPASGMEIQADDFCSYGERREGE